MDEPEQLSIFTLSSSYPGYHVTVTETNPVDVNFIVAPIITNADQGALVSWQAIVGCGQNSEAPPYSYVRLGTCTDGPENHLTTISNGAIASDVIWDSGVLPWAAVEPVLQLEDGLLAGTAETAAGDVLLVFDASGEIKWSVPDVVPSWAVSGGGLIGTAVGGGTFMFSSQGVATAQLSTLPDEQSWRGKSYRYGSVAQVLSRPVLPARSFWVRRGGNQSGTGAFTIGDEQKSPF